MAKSMVKTFLPLFFLISMHTPIYGHGSGSPYYGPYMALHSMISNSDRYAYLNLPPFSSNFHKIFHRHRDI